MSIGITSIGPAGTTPSMRAVWLDLLGQSGDSALLAQLAGAAPSASEFLLGRPNSAELAAFVALVLADDAEQLGAIADRVIVQSGGRESLLMGLLLPAAQMLGEMWERDQCDFMAVTLGVYRLDQIMKQTAAESFAAPVRHGYDSRILMLPAPGEQHRFGADMVADAFREDGWCVRSGPAVARARLLFLARDEWFDVIGLSVGAERALKGLASCVRALRQASCNPNLFIMLGGHAITNNPERARFLGADGTAATAQEAVLLANNFIEATVTDGLHQSMTRLVDVG